MCSLAGTIFFLRSITMLITSLSVPGIHIQCSSQRYGSLVNKLYGAWNILSGVGLYLHGVRTCGDYMFSGHTVCLTLLSHFISECKCFNKNYENDTISLFDKIRKLCYPQLSSLCASVYSYPSSLPVYYILSSNIPVN